MINLKKQKNMKKLFTLMVVSFCGIMAYAQTISMQNVTMSPGETKTIEVSISNPSNYTAFQFDLTLPKGIKIKNANMKGSYGSDRVLKNQLINQNSNKYRFLSYDGKNAGFQGSGAVAVITLEAETDAESGTITGSDMLVVKPDGTSSSTTASATVTINASITIGSSGKTTFVCDRDLDFSNVADVKAYIATGYDLVSNDLWLTRVTDVPANTPIWVKGPANSTKAIPFGTSSTYYPTTLLVGSATQSVNIPAEDADFKNWTLMSDGSIIPQPSGVSGFPAQKAYLHIPKAVTSSVGSDKTLTLASTKNTTLVYGYDLDFSNVSGLRAYTITGYGKDGTIWLTRVMKASAGTPLYLKGDAAGDYTIPSTEQQIYYANMLRGDATTGAALTSPSDGMTIFLLYSDGIWAALSGQANYPEGKSYFAVPSSYIAAASRGMGDEINNVFENESEVMVIKLGKTAGEDNRTTAIRAIDAQQSDDAWFNLNGQRIDTPTKKGLYIKNGKKVIVR